MLSRKRCTVDFGLEHFADPTESCHKTMENRHFNSVFDSVFDSVFGDEKKLTSCDPLKTASSRMYPGYGS